MERDVSRGKDLCRKTLKTSCFTVKSEKSVRQLTRRDPVIKKPDSIILWIARIYVH